MPKKILYYIIVFLAAVIIVLVIMLVRLAGEEAETNTNTSVEADQRNVNSQPNGTAECQSDTDCVIGGCNRTICYAPSEGSGISICDWRDEYRCYSLASCGCINGKCAWEKGDDFDDCWRDPADY
ncbi:MAG: eight-cysteine-cluster domain-containing protein [Patescibacteria group bacterium]